ncbi:MAG: class I SAM-dependent methyltransferase [Bdellovibrionales bacterium]|nr:class I SAM-dependent methyltransferase [Bdellovibrionales bacterium]
MNPVVSKLLYQVYSAGRAANYVSQSEILEWATWILVPGYQRTRSRYPLDEKQREDLRTEVVKLLEKEAKDIQDGFIPLECLIPESPWDHWKRFPKVLLDTLRISRRREKGRTTEFGTKEKQLSEEMPRYFRRNFHFQTGGYLSKDSAEVYEHEVEILFGGMADPMRRMIVSDFKKRAASRPGGLARILELGAGTGRTTSFMARAFPRTKIVATDLSPVYLRHARAQLDDRLSLDARVSFLEADATQLPFKDGEFDAVYSVFLFHELPEDERKKVLAEMNRVVRPGGIVGWVDSLQFGDVPSMDIHLERFPTRYHEPFYRNYAETQMRPWIAELGWTDITERTGFLSKCVSAIRS